MRYIVLMVHAVDERIRVGISTCLLGEQVRYDGGHKHDRFLTDVLGEYFDWVSVCPELEVGMGVPRAAVRLVGSTSAPRMVGGDSGEDWTDRMLDYSKKRVAQLGKLDLCGYILKSKSPSCGMERVKICNPKGIATKSGRGIYAEVLIKGHPLIPVEEEGRLNNPRLRENFIVRVFAYHRLRRLMDSRLTAGKLVEFHTAEKYLLMSHSEKHYRGLGRLVGNVKKTPMSELKEKYSELYMECLKVRATVRKNVNVLQRIVGFLPEELPGGDKKEVLQVIEDYRKGFVPLVVPLTLLRHHVRAHSIGYIANQVYLNPHPKELMLRNHV
ncbi:MAG TPA: DUF523 and DUF1722 domain-containing protein [Bacteroidota bacterium]|nr:DUF523 and DUF1722 domain-containing protein [Bacteroidota bacterium]